MGKKRGVKFSEAEVAYVLRAAEVVGSKVAFYRRVIEVGRQVDSRIPPSESAAKEQLRAIVNGEHIMEWAKTLYLLTAEHILQNVTAPPKPSDAAQSVVPPTTQVMGADRLQRRLHEKSVQNADLDAQLQEMTRKFEDKREEALRLDGQLRGAKAHARTLEEKYEAARQVGGELVGIEHEMVELLKEIVMSENGSLDPLLLKAARLVMTHDKEAASG